MADVTSAVTDLDRGAILDIMDPEIGEVMVLLPEPQQTQEIEPGVEHFVFTHPSGRMIGLNWEAPDGKTDWKTCALVGDEDGFHHALLVRDSGGVRLLTRREPGEPDDWEEQGEITDVEILEQASDATDAGS